MDAGHCGLGLVLRVELGRDAHCRKMSTQADHAQEFPSARVRNSQ